ncbi:MAG: ABC transporter permease [Magnetospirillum sp.]|jgi:ABC-type spermidine/putrescine transport system permease subunit II|nr:ABC transporter permease [Magnetospirillum sp.]
MKHFNPVKAMLGLAAALALAFLLVPLLLVVAVSFSPSVIFDLPSRGLSLRWYEAVGSLTSFWRALRVSIEIAAVATAAAVILGTMAAFAIHFGRFRGAAAIQAFVMSPLMLPGIVKGIALLQASRMFGLSDAFLLLAIGHTVLAIPLVARTLLASLASFDPSIIDAARTLGYSYSSALARIVVPNLLPGIFTGGVFAFLASFDNYSVSLFVASVRARPLPIQMIQYLEEGADPTVAAICTILIVVTAILLLLADRAVGLRRIAAG